MPRGDVERDFPGLVGVNYGLSDENFNVNCLAYAMGDSSNWWEPPNGQGQYWPDGFDEDTSVKTIEKILKLHGYTEEIEIGTMPTEDAIAIYGDGKEWMHFAKFSNGTWSSKLGDGHDVDGHSLEHLVGHIYGGVCKILSRPEKDKPQ
jgi:hypothetical protein